VLDEVEHPRLPEIFSQAETVFRGLLSIGFLVTLANYAIMKRHLLAEIGLIYFSNFNTLSKSELKENKELKTKLQDEFLRKGNFFSLIHEISKLQLSI
jgi:hypothetical protein